MSIDCQQYALAAQQEKCNELNTLMQKYQMDLTKLQSFTPASVFSKTMQLQQFRDQNWQDNYQIETQKDQINKIHTNLNQVVSAMAADYNQGAHLADIGTHTKMDYEKLNRDLEDELAEHERRASAAQDKIVLRNRLITLNNDSARWKDTLIMLLQSYFFVVLLLIPAFVAYMADSLSAGGFFGVFLFLNIIYLIYVLIEAYYNKNNSNLRQVISDDINAIDNRIYNFGQNIKRSIKDDLRSRFSKARVGDPRDWEFNGPGYVPVSHST